jgi:hypothetical protein
VITSHGVTYSSRSVRVKNRRGVAANQDQHVDDLAALVDGLVDVAPDAVDVDVGLVDEPPALVRADGIGRRQPAAG